MAAAVAQRIVRDADAIRCLHTQRKLVQYFLGERVDDVDRGKLASNDQVDGSFRGDVRLTTPDRRWEGQLEKLQASQAVCDDKRARNAAVRADL
eukprot:5187255-Prymnesium_polylepis.1